ncbi:MAG TPA: flagellar hook-associated protein FlgK [Bryobacteraceae bacterium]|nr:flagellar hook-associated protein FlgK [Bryobacteraceae bacterium]
MSNILATLSATASSFSAYEEALEVVSNNTTNSTTPGYANQSVNFQADAFNPADGGAGGVTLGPDQSSRNAYAEYNVQSAQTDLNYSSTLASQLQAIEPLFDLQTSSGSDSGVGGTLNQLFAAFSQLSVNPNDSSYRQAVLNAAGNMATAFNEAANGLSTAAETAESDAQSTVSSINSILGQIQQINAQKEQNAGAATDPGIDAQLYSDLENLSQLVNITTTTTSDGETNIYLGGQQPLLVGGHQYSLGTSTASGQLTILDASGNDIGSFVTGGSLGALVHLTNTLIPNYQGQLNQLAQGVADTVNNQLTSGTYQDASGTTQPGVALFTYNSAAVAKTLALTSITTTQVAAASTANPGGNDNAVALNNLQSAAIPVLSNLTFAEYYGTIGSNVGADSAQAQNNQTTQQQLLSQAQTLRSNISGVSLDQEATLMTEYQQSYDAVSKLMSVLQDIVQTVLDLIALPGTT